MTVRFYSSLDTGAPTLSGSRAYDKIKQILKACLVDGYGGKAPAGWSVGHEHADGFSLGNGDGFVNLVASGTSTTVLFLMEWITDGSAALAAGYNRRSGAWYDGSSATGRQFLYWSAHAGSNPHWAVVADDKTFILTLGASLTGPDTASVGSSLQLYVGKYLNASGLSGFCSLGGWSNSSGQGFFFECNAGTCLRHPLSGVVDQGVSPFYFAGAGSYGQTLDAESRAACVVDKISAVRSPLMAVGAGLSGAVQPTSAIYAGRLRGVVYDPYLAGLRPSQVFGLLGAGTSWQDRVKLISMPNGDQWLPFYGMYTEYGGFVSMNPLDWE